MFTITKKLISIFFISLFVFTLFFLIFTPSVIAAKDKCKLDYIKENRIEYCWKKEQCFTDNKGVKATNIDDERGCTKNGAEKTNYCFETNKITKDCCGKDEGFCYTEPTAINLQVQIPGNPGDLLGESINTLGESNNTKVDNRSITDRTADVTGFPAYLKVLYRYFISIIGIVAVTMIAYGWYEWLMAAGSAEKISKAKNTIQGAMIGLLLGIGSYAILNVINDKLVNFSGLRVERIKPVVLATDCSDSSLVGVKDWVLKIDPSSNVDKTPNCGKEYVSQNNPSQECKGSDCSGESEKPYCIKRKEKDGGWKCVSKEEIINQCKSNVGTGVSAECEAVDKIWETSVPYWRCYYDAQIGRTSAGCNSTNLNAVPDKFKRIDCKDGTPVCYDSSIYKRRCKNLDQKRVGSKEGGICVKQTNGCLNAKPASVNCGSLGLYDDCQYIKTGEDRWCAVGISKWVYSSPHE